LADGKVTAFVARQGRIPVSPKCLARGRDGALWTGDSFGLTCIKEGIAKHYAKGNDASGIIDAILPDREGNVWIGAYSGLSLFVGGSFVPASDEHLAVDRVFCLFQDREDNVWAGSEVGLVRLTPRQLTTYTKVQGLMADSIGSVCASRDGSVWVGVWGGGLNHFVDGGFTVMGKSNGLASDFVMAVHEARDGSLWVGTDYGAGLNHIVEGRIIRYGAADGVDPAVLALAEDTQGNVWIGSRNSLTCFKEERFRRYTTREGLTSNQINALCERQEGGLWIGTEQGLTQWWKDGPFVNLAASEPRLRKTILSLYEDPQQTLWVGTRGAGVVRFKEGVLFNFTSRQGLLSDSIYAVLEDGRDNLWFNSSKGIFSVSKAQLEEMTGGARSTLHCVWYCKTAQYQEVIQPAATRALDGRLWFRTTHGVVVVDPNATLNDVPPPVVIETVLADKQRVREPSAQSGMEAGKSGSADDRATSGEPAGDSPLALLQVPSSPVRIPPSRGELDIHYAALSLRAPEMNRFKYRLEGVDSEWVDAGSRRAATGFG
jgi:ligand-binding sensor domain-containing protein